MSSKNSSKRSVYRVRNDMAVTAIGTSSGSNIMYTADEDVTLVRVRGHFTAYDATTVTGQFLFEWLLSIWPRGQSVAADPTTTLNTAQDAVPDEELLRQRGVISKQTNGAGHMTYEWEFDSKAMRKLRKDDEIRLSRICNSASSVGFVGTIYLWFKEA